ncbi:MAG: ATP-NAD kinase [Thermoprotei archaeon]|nr:MAG: ATP-NAD kinase [Thermoprotei archaeon]
MAEGESEKGKRPSLEEALRLLSSYGLGVGYEDYTRFISEGVKVGFVVKPIAGMGGRVGLKGTDGEETLRKALELGAKPIAPKRAVETLRALKVYTPPIKLYTYPEEMGEYEALDAGFTPIVVGKIASKPTTSEDTKKAVEEFTRIPVDLIVFVGGDGTAKDVMEANKLGIPVAGVPAGVKMHSSVFAVTPEAAARLVAHFAFTGLPTRMAEVMDVDEQAFREGRVSAKLLGYMPTPYEPTLVQHVKKASSIDQERLEQLEAARKVVESMEPGVAYILGPGTTVQAIAELLGLEKTLLGVDVVMDGEMVEKDANEERLLRAIEGVRAKIVVSPIGGQGFIFGRGNQQISPEVIRKVGKGNIVVVATRKKLKDLDALRVDTGDPELDMKLRGKIKVLAGDEVVEMEVL